MLSLLRRTRLLLLLGVTVSLIAWLVAVPVAGAQSVTQHLTNDPPPPPQVIHDTATFSTTNQNMWGAGAASAPGDIIDTLFNQSWNASGSAGSVVDVTLDPCSALTGGLFHCSHDFGDFGATFSAGTEGQIGLTLTLKGANGGSISVSYPVNVTFTTPAADSFAPGTTVTVQTSWSAGSAGKITTTYPSLQGVDLSGTVGAHFYVNGEVCLFSCFINGNIIPPINMPGCTTPDSNGVCDSTATADILDLSTNDLGCFTTADDLEFDFATSTDFGTGPNPCGDQGYIFAPNVGVSTTVNPDNSLTATGDDPFALIPIDGLGWTENVIPSLWPSGTVDLGSGFSLDYTPLTSILTTLIDEQQSLNFMPKLDLTLAFPRSLAYAVHDSGNALYSQGTSAQVSFPAGDSIDLTIPEDQQTALTISPSGTLEPGNDFTNTTQDVVSESYQFKLFGGGLDTPSASLDICQVLGLVAPLPTTCPVQVWPGLFIGIPSLFSLNHDFGQVGTYSVSGGTWQLGGFQTQSMTPFDLTPDPDPVPTALTIKPIEGASLTTAVADFHDPDPNAAGNQASGDYTATIDWGDGTPLDTAATITGTDDAFAVNGTHTYAEEGTYAVTVIVNDTTTTGVTATALSTADVADAALTTTSTPSFNETEGAPFSGGGTMRLASFTDADPAGTVADYSATIDWGDSTPADSSTSISANGSGGFDVFYTGTHVYEEEGHYTVTVTVYDAGGSSTIAQDSMTVADAALHSQGVTNDVTANGQHVLLWPNPPAAPVSPNDIVATFTDDDPHGVVADYSVTIDWGDGLTSAGTVTGTEGGPFAVHGSHTYAADQLGFHTVTVTITDHSSQTVATTTALSYGFTSGGTFVLGDQSDSAGVTFWSARWAKLNALSAGAAPNDFKGFEDDPTTPASCGVDWTTSPGNSASPPTTVPSFMAVIVSSQVTANGSVISGDTNEVMIVQTNPGYGPAPGQSGTGTVVAVVCGSN